MATVGEAFEVPFVERVTDRRGRGIADADVIFHVESGDAVFHDPGDDCSPLFPTEIVSTTADGYAGVLLTPLSAGPVTVATQVSNHLGQPPLIFTAEASSPGWILSKVSGDNQVAAETGEQLESFVVKLTTDQGEPVSGVAVSWEVTSGGGSLHSSICSDLDTIPGTLTARTIDDGTTGPWYFGVFFVPGVAGESRVSANVIGALGSLATSTPRDPIASFLLPSRFPSDRR